MKKILMISLLLLIIPFNTISAEKNLNYTPNQLLVFTDETASNLNISSYYTTETLTTNVELLTFPPSVDIENIKEQLTKDNIYVEYNYYRYFDSDDIDPYKESNSHWWLENLQAATFWPLSKLQVYTPTIAIIDSGITKRHEDLSEQIILPSFNVINYNNDVSDNNGHGTMIAGIIGATYNNNIGIDGVTGPFDVKLLPIKASNFSGSITVYDSIRAIDYAIENGADVLNLSFGGTGYSMLENMSIQKAVKANINVVASSGNTALGTNEPIYPANYLNVISVGAINEQNEIANFSTYNKGVDFVAPGHMITTIDLNNLYTTVSGTSFSAPMVASSLAMIKALLPHSTSAEREELLKLSTVDLGDAGKDVYYGEGLINLEMAANQVSSHLGYKTIFGRLSITNPVEFKKMIVGNDKVFTVTFNDTLSSNNNFEESIIIFNKNFNIVPNETYSVSLNLTDNSKLTVEPRTTWEYGDYYLVLSNKITNEAGDFLNSNYKLQFTVQ
ncbi:S8 family serine peptidase [Sporosarcina sp. SAFN-015]|uniref:S8 family serine peptidase n=1 Tax=Sporosarcina sp. SAFN-015 TaxID=3387274 RepID=UPI003F7D8CEF